MFGSFISGVSGVRKVAEGSGGRKLEFDDIRHYQKVVAALGETIRLSKERCLVEMVEA